MKTVDFGAYIVVYNFIVGVLFALSSEKLGAYAGYLGGRYRENVSRITRLSAATFGSSVAVLSAFVYIVFHLLRIGL